MAQKFKNTDNKEYYNVIFKNIKYIYYRPPTKLRESNAFSCVC